ncbi:MAG: hypothetical protein ACTSPV_07260 [Candidatus Hodarchaeales archaeon]
MLSYNILIIMTGLINDLFEGFVVWYVDQLNLSTPLKAIFFLIIGYLTLTILFSAFPFLKTIADWLTYPSRFLHLYDHVEVSRQIKDEIKREAPPVDQDSLSEEVRTLDSGTYNRFDIRSSAEGSNFYANCSSYQDMVRIAMASWRRALYLGAVYLALIPFLPLNFVVVVFHMYIALVIFHTTLPSSGDYQAVLYALLERGLIPKRWAYWIEVVFYVTFFVNLLSTHGDIFISLFTAIIISYLYFILLISVVQFINRYPNKTYPRLRIIPDNRSDRKYQSLERPHKKMTSLGEFNYK